MDATFRHAMHVCAIATVLASGGCGNSPNRLAALTEVAITEIDDSRQGVDLGFGWRGNEGVPAPSRCVQFEQSQKGGQTTSFDVTEVVDKASMLQTLKLSSSMGWKGLVGSIEGKASFARTVDLASDSSNFSLLSKVENSVRFAGPLAETVNGRLTGAINVDLMPHYRDLAKSNLQEFQRQCGDSYVHAAHEGAELAAVISFLRTTNSEREELSTSVSGSYLRFEASGSLDSVLQRYHENSRLKITYHLAGGSGQPVPTDKNQLIQTARNLAEAAKASPVIFKFGVVSYTNLPSWPGTQLPASDWNPDLVARQFGRLRTVFEETSQALSKPDEWILDRGVTTADVKVLRDELQKRLASIEATGDACEQAHAVKCELKSEDAAPDYSYRARMPLRHSAFQFERDIAAKDEALKALRQQLASVQAVRETGSLNELANLNAKEARLNRQIPQVEQEIAGLREQYAAKLHDAIFDFWLRYPAKIRCKADPTKDCPSESDLAAYAKSIVTK